MTRSLSVLVPDVPPAAHLGPYLRRIDETRQYSNNGPLVRELEARLASELGVRPENVVTVANGTLGLELALIAATHGITHRVICPAFTFPATATAILRVGARPIWVDVDPQAWSVTPKTVFDSPFPHNAVDAVVPVCPFGAPVDYLQWSEFVQQTGTPVVIDAAAAWGNLTFPFGSQMNVYTVFSMHATKTLPAGEGGLVVGPQEGIAHIRALANFGMVDNVVRYAGGTNAKLSEYGAAVALASLDWMPVRRERRTALAEQYRQTLYACPKLFQLPRPMATYPQVFPIALRTTAFTRDQLVEALADHHIQTRSWYCPLVCNHPGMTAPSSLFDRHLPVSRQLAGQLLCIPFHLELTPGDVDYLFQTLAAATEGLHHPV